MKKNNIIIYVSSKNNYDMFGGEVLKNINTEGFELINIDDNSSTEEIKKGKQICKENDIVFLENKSVGVQMATQTLIDFINKNRPHCKWIICFQHDNWPLSDNFFERLSKLIDTKKLDEFGGLGFNLLDEGEYSGDSYNRWKGGESVSGMLGLAHLSVKSNTARWLTDNRNQYIKEQPEKWKKPFIVEMPLWAIAGINVKLWNECIKPTTDYQFHLWYPDVAIQFNYHNKAIIVLPDLYCMNNQRLKTKYGMNHNSAAGSNEGDEYHFGRYSNHDAWIERWGWNYESPWENFFQIKENYKGTLIYDFYYHEVSNGPLKSYDLGEY
tara:strand:+ start:201 stop:1175 length:975 start_codon:yes stop_codon:yes gene_type:complete